jgi:hypothetical protein
MAARVQSVAFQGIDVVPVDVQVTIASGLPAFAKAGSYTRHPRLTHFNRRHGLLRDGGLRRSAECGGHNMLMIRAS